MHKAQIDLRTPDGTCDTFIAAPDDRGSFPGVIFNMDAYGLRPWLEEMATTLASRGYFVMVPNLFYRTGRAPVLKLKFPLGAAEAQVALGQIMPLIRALTPEMMMSDAGAFIEFLSRNPRVRQGRIGTTGYCMGGRVSFRTAAAFPDRVVAAAAFHTGNLATEADSSPHLHAKKIRAELYFGYADNDQSASAEQIERMGKALDEAKVTYESEVYRGALHGYAMKDLPVFNEQALERHWTKLFDLFGRQLQG